MIELAIDYKLIGTRIRAARKESNLTQSVCSERVGISENHLSHIECGVAPLSLPALLAICHVLNCTADRLLYDNLPFLNQMYLKSDISKCFQDATMDESSVMIAVADAAKTAMRSHIR